MNQPIPHQHQFARPFPPGACAIGRPAGSSRQGRAAAIIHDQDQMGADTALGRRLVCRLAPALGRGGDHVVAGWNGRGFSLTALFPNTPTTNLPGLRSRLFWADGTGSNRSRASIQCRRQGSFQRIAKCPPNHSKASSSNASNASDGASHYVGQITQGLGND